MAWVVDNRTLTQSEMENNADIIIAYFRGQGYSDETISAILGNMQWESSVSPHRTEYQGSGYGLVQWTPVSKLQDHCSILNLSPYDSGDIQLQVLDKELGTLSVNEWYTTQAFISRYYSSGANSSMIGITPQEFKTNSMNFNIYDLCTLFMAGYERPDYSPSVNHIAERKSYTR